MAAPVSRTTRSGLSNISIVRGPPRFTPYTMRRQRHPFELALTRVRYKQHTSNTKQLPRATSSGSKLFSDPEHAVCCTTCWSRARKTYKPNNQHVNGMSKCYRPRSYQASRSYEQKTKYTPRHRHSRTSCTQQLRKRLLLRNVVRLNATNRKVYLFLISTTTHSTYLQQQTSSLLQDFTIYAYIIIVIPEPYECSTPYETLSGGLCLSSSSLSKDMEERGMDSVEDTISQEPEATCHLSQSVQTTKPS